MQNNDNNTCVVCELFDCEKAAEHLVKCWTPSSDNDDTSGDELSSFRLCNDCLHLHKYIGFERLICLHWAAFQHQESEDSSPSFTQLVINNQ